MKNFKFTFWLFALLLIGFTTQAQVTGTKNVPGDYLTLQDAITALNTEGVGAGGATINLLAGNPQTAPAGGYVIGGAGSALFASTSNANQVIIKGNGNTITASGSLTAGALNDAIFKIIGADWITIQEFVMQENAANTVTTAASNTMTEWGVALLYETTTNGAQNNTILNNTISLVRTYQNTFGIYSNSTHSATAVTTSATATTTNGGNSNLKIYGNSISNVNNGICIVGPTAAADHNNGVDIGGTSAITGNIISNYGSTGTFSSYSNVSGTVNGVLVRNSINLNISYNNITSSSAGTTSGTLRGVFCPAFSNTPIGTFIQNITNNVISVIGGNATGTAVGVLCESTVANSTSTLNINNNTFQNSSITGATSGSLIGLQNSASSITPGTLNMNNNVVQNNSLSGTGTFTGIDGGVSTNLFMNNNTVSNNTKTGASGSIYLTRASTSIVTYSGNNVFDNSFTASSGTTSASIYGYYNYGSPTVENIFNNNIYNLYINGTNTSTSSLLNGIHTNTSSTATKNIYNNTIHTFTTVSGSVNGISQSLGTTVKIYNNNIYNLLNNVATTSVAQVNGITVSSGTCYLYNNFISDLKAPTSTSTDAIRGINITSSTSSSTIGVYHNTIYLNATGGANFGTSGIFHTVNATATTASLDMRNNIINNSSTPAGTGLTVAFRRSGTALNNYDANSNNNILYAGVASASNLLCHDGTTGDQTRDEFRTRVTPRDASSFAENTTFINTATTPYNLRVNTGLATYCESGGNTVSTPISITDDFDGTVRGILPDVGANEFNGIAAGLLNPSAVTATTISSNQINIAFTPNASSNNVIIVWNSTGTFTTPSGAPGAVGDAFAGGTILSIGTTSPINHTSLTGNTTYYYKLFSNAGTDYSTGVTVNANTNLAAPTAFTATASSASQINLVWTKNSFDNNVIIATNSTSTFGTPVQATAYAVNDPITGGGTVIYNGPASGFNHTSLTASTTYYYKAWSVDGNSYYSSGVSANANTTMLAPTAFTATVISASQINLAWTKNSFNNDVIVATNSTSTFGTPVNGTPLAVNDAIVGGGTVIYKGAATGYNHTSLTANTAYYYKAWSVDESSNYSSASVSANATTPCNVISTFPNIENFEATTIPSCWSELRTPTSSSYGWTSYATGYENKGFRFDSYVNSSGNKSMLKTPTYNISALSSARIEFWWKNPTGGNFKVLLSTDGGVTFPNTLADNLTAQTDWVLKTIDISAYVSGGNNVVIGFEGTSNYGNGDAYVYLDKFSIGEIPSCGNPTALNTGTITTTSAVLNWSVPAEGIPTGYNWIVVARGAGSGAATVANGISATTTATANGLTTATQYDFFVKTNCGGTLSAWAGPFGFITDCGVGTLPYSQNFESAVVPNMPICTSIENAGLGNNWITANNPGSGFTSKALKYTYHSTQDANAWFYTQALHLNAGTSYRISFKYGGSSSYGTESLKVAYGLSATSTSMTNVLQDFPSIEQGTQQFTEYDFTPSTTGDYFFGFNAYSIADQYSLLVDDIRIRVTPTCFEPTAVTVSNINPSGATFSWTAPVNGTPANYIWKVVASDSAATASAIATGTVAHPNLSTSTSALSANTPYTLYVKTDCGSGDNSVWTEAKNFKTLCNYVNIPVVQNFDGATTPNMPDCWNKLVVSTSGSLTTTTGTPNSTPNHAYFYNSSDNASNILLISPGIVQNLNTTQVKFYAKGGAGYQLILGTMTDPTNASTFTPINTFNLTANYALYEFYLNNYAGTDKFIALKHGNGSTYRSIYVDDISIEALPTCFKPDTLTVTPATTSASIAWVNGKPTDTSWEISYKKPTDGSWTVVTANSNPFTITPLETNTSYQVKVRTDCGSGDNSVWTEAKNFKTLCNYVNIPVVQNFDGATTPNMPDCWNKLVVSTSGSLTTTTGTPNSTPNHAYFYNSSDNASNILLISPGIVQNLNTTQVKFYAKGDAGYQIILGTMSDPTNAATFTPINTFNLTANYALYEFYLNNYAGTDKFIALKHGNGGTYRSIYVDDISIEALPTCFKPNTLTVTPAATSASIAWVNGKPTDTSWEISYKKPTDGSWTVVSANSNPFNITPLETNTSYQVKVRTDCGAGDFSEFTSVVNFNTTQLASGLPFTEGFETGLTNWTVLNGSQTNKWFAGTATFNTGAQAAYISNDNGTSNAYTTSSASSITHIYRDIAFPTGNPVDMTFNWKGLGESSYDFLKVYMIPTTITPVEGTEIDAAYQVGAIRYNLQSAWQTANIALPSNILGTTYRLVFSWKNDGGGGDQPPIAIDNISIIQQACATPQNLTTTLTPSSATVNWTAGTTDQEWEVAYWRVDYDIDWTVVPTTTKPYTINGLVEAVEYDIRVRAKCAEDVYGAWSATTRVTIPCNVINLPYSENFATTSFPACWSQTYSGALTSNRWTVSTTNSAGGTANEMKASYQNNTGISRLIMPALNTVGLSEIQLKFKTYYRDDDIGANLKIQTSNDKTNWTDVYTYATGSGDIPSGTTITVPITTNLNGTTYIAYVIDGNHFMIYNWYIDNVIVLAPSSAKEITALTIPNQVGNSVIDGGTATVVVTMPYGTDKTALIPTITVSDFASINPASDVAQNFTAAVPYTVTAENNTTKVWTVTVNNLPPSTEAEITALTIPGQVGVSEIISATGTINVHVPYGTDRNGLIPTITTSTFATINPSSDVAQNFNSPVVYTVTAQDVSVTKLWTVNVIVDPASQAADILTFTFPEQTGPAVIDNVNHTVHIEVAAGTNRNGLVPTITTSQYSTITPASGIAQNFTAPFIYNVHAQDVSVIIPWTVTVTEAPYVLVNWDFPNNPDDAIADGGIAANLTRTIGAVGTGVINYTNAGVTTFSALANGWNAGMDTKYWVVDFSTQGYKNITLSSVQRSSTTGPRDFKVQYKIGTAGTWTDFANNQITVATDYTTSLFNQALPVETYNQSDLFVRWIMTSNTSVGGGVVALNGTQRIDDIIVKGVPMMHDAEIITFATNLTQTGPATINSTNATVTINVPNGTVVTSVIPTIEISSMATINPASGVTQDFTNPLTYTVTAEDGTEKVWTVTVIVNPIPTYTVSVVSANGTVTGSGSYEEAANVTLTATPAEGYTFVNWTDINGVVSTANPFTFAMPANNLNYTANYAAIDYNVVVTNNPVVGGSVVGAGTYNFGNAVTLTATPAIGYNFVNWTIAGTEVGTALTYNFNMPSHNVSVVANYTIVDYTIALTSNPVDGGTTTGAGTYNYNNNVTLTATPATGYAFVNWTSNLGSEVANPFTFTMPASDITGVANFAKIDYTLTVNVNPAIGGSVTGNNATYNYNDVVSLVATPEAGYEFLNWTVNGSQVSTNANYSFNMPANNVTIAANFILTGTTTYELDLTVSPANSGNVVGAGSYVDGTVVALTATPVAGFTFVSWTDGFVIVSTNASFDYTMPTSNKTLVANFAAIDYSVAVAINPLTSGTVTGEGTTYHVGDLVTLTATPAEGYEFVNWTDVNGEVSTMNPHIFSMPAANVNLTANFALVNYAVAASTLPVGAGTITGTGTYTFGQSVTLETTPNAGYTFVNWTVAGTEVATTTTYTFNMPSNDVTAVANYTANDYNVAVTIDPIATGTVSGTGVYHVGDEVTITATPEAGYTFVNWTNTVGVVSTANTLTFTMGAANVDLTANFAAIDYNVTLTANPVAGGNVTGTGTFNVGNNVTVSATPNAGYIFENWSDANGVVSTSATYIFTMPASNVALTANFTAVDYSVSVTIDPLASGTVTGTGNYNVGNNVTLVATPVAGYNFVNWTDGTGEVSTNATYSFIMPAANVALTAHFVAIDYTVTVNVAPAASGTTTGAGTYNVGQDVSLTATPATGYQFVNWTEGATVLSTTTPYNFTMPAENKVITANFAVITYPLTLQVNPVAAGSVSGAGSYAEGTTVSVSTTPASANFVFLNWTNGATVVSTSPSFSYTMPNAATTLVANYQDVTSINENSINGISVYPNPSTGIFNIVADKAYDMQIVDITGRLVLSQKVEAGNNTLQMEQYNVGVYFIRLISNSEIKTVRIVKQQ